LLARALGELDEGSSDALAERRRLAARRRIAATACDAAACVRAALGDRPDVGHARQRALADLRARIAGAPAPGPALSVARGVGEVARLALALPVLPEGEDWELGALAFVDEAPLRELYDGCLALAEAALREAAESS
jgi:hypothetical protein